MTAATGATSGAMIEAARLTSLGASAKEVTIMAAITNAVTTRGQCHRGERPVTTRSTRAARPMLLVASANPVMITAAITNAVMTRAATPMLPVANASPATITVDTANVSLVMITAEEAKQG